MSPAQKKIRRNQRKKFFRQWHRRIGFTTSLFLFNLAITGIILNHYEVFSLHKNYLQSSLLLDWYNVKAPQSIDCIKHSSSKNNNYEFCQVGSQLYHISDKDKFHSIAFNSNSLVSLIQKGEELYLVTDNIIYIFTKTYQLIETFEFGEEIALPVQAAIGSDTGLYLKADDQLILFDWDHFEILQIPTTEFPSNSEQTLKPTQLTDETLIQSLSLAYRQQQISYLKFIQDLHSGQILSLQGKILTDLVGIIILLLAISGFITWKRRKKRSTIEDY